MSDVEVVVFNVELGDFLCFGIEFIDCIQTVVGAYTINHAIGRGCGGSHSHRQFADYGYWFEHIVEIYLAELCIACTDACPCIVKYRAVYTLCCRVIGKTIGQNIRVCVDIGNI